MSSADESGRDEEPRPHDSEAAPSPEPAARPEDRAAASCAEDGLVDETMAGVLFGGERGGRDRQTADDMRSFGVDLDAPRTGAKVAVGANATAIERLYHNATGASGNQAYAGPVAARLIKSIVDTHVATADYETLRDTLLRYGVAYTSGEDGSGRLATAYAVLAELCGHDKIVAIDLDDDADVATVLKQGDLLRAGHGHVVELPAHQPAPRKQTLATAGGMFADTNFHLVVVGPPGATEHALQPYEVRHRSPAPAAVLDRHLPHLLGLRTNWPADQITAFVATCRHAPGIAERLCSPWQPGEVVRLARRLVDIGLRGGRPDEALELLPDALRELAVAVLRDANEGGGDVHTLRRLTARVAYGLFSGRPLTVVFELASLLFAALPSEEQSTHAESQLVRTVFDGGMESLIDQRMRARRGEDDDGDRVARLVDPELATAVVDVVWHDYDHLRGPFLQWLCVLGGDPRQQVCDRAGQLAGQLALHDFGTVYRELLRPWARSRNKTHRQSAAWAMARAVLEPRLTARVCRQVRDWTYSPDRFLNDTAARAYATRLGAEFADEPLAHLWLVALRSELVISPAVAVAVAALHQPDDPETGLAVLTELGRWTEDRTRSLHVHAARAVTFLAHRTASPPHDRWPALLRQAAENQEARDLLVTLWRATLAEPMVAAKGWQALLTWLLRPAEPGELHEFTVAFATDLLRIPVLRARAVFHLSQWLPRHPDALVLHQVRHNL